MSMTDYATRDWSGPDWRNGANGVNHVEFTKPASGHPLKRPADAQLPIQ